MWWKVKSVLRFERYSIRLAERWEECDLSLIFSRINLHTAKTESLIPVQDTKFNPGMNFLCKFPATTRYSFGATAPSGPGLPHSRSFSITHNDLPQTVGLLWTSDQLVAETSTWQYTTLTRDKIPCPPVGFEPTISAGKRPQTYALDCAVTGTGRIND